MHASSLTFFFLNPGLKSLYLSKPHNTISRWGPTRAPPTQIPIPVYTIDLSLPPAQRYIQVASDFSPKMRALTPLFDEVLLLFVPFAPIRRLIESLASLFLFRVYSSEETNELKGIAKASGVSLYFLVALNVLLDSLLGCTSGGVMTDLTPRKKRKEKRMMHFRTLDWGMDGLRSVLVVLEFVKRDSSEPEKVIARTVTYAGFVGILTGVREDLSVSLNFRPNHTCSTLSLRFHQFLVIFGLRRSISSILRSTILPDPEKSHQTLSTSQEKISQPRTVPCYIVLCDGVETIVLEKDLKEAKVRTSKEFIVHTNHDTPPEDSFAQGGGESGKVKHEVSSITGMDELVEESTERRACVQRKWDSLKARQEKKFREREGREEEVVSVREETLKGWIKADPVMNESTHFACILDPKMGRIRFLERGVEDDSDEDACERFNVSD